MTDRPAARRYGCPALRAKRPRAAAPELVPAEQVTAALEAAAEFKDKLLRTLAEMENLRKRTEREVADARLYGNRRFRPRRAGGGRQYARALAKPSTPSCASRAMPK